MHRQPCHMLLGRSVMRTEMHGSFTEHRGSRLAVGQTGLGQYGNERMAILLNFSSLVLNLLSPFLSEFFWLFNAFFFSYVFESDLEPNRVGAGCGGQQEDALPQLCYARLRGDGNFQGPARCHRPGPGPPVFAAVRMGQTLEQPRHRHKPLPLQGPDQLTLQ